MTTNGHDQLLLKQLQRHVALQQQRLAEGCRVKVPMVTDDGVRELYSLFVALSKESQEGFNTLEREIETMLKSNTTRVQHVLQSEAPKSPKAEEPSKLEVMNRVITKLTKE